jgi:hypothetical protein
MELVTAAFNLMLVVFIATTMLSAGLGTRIDDLLGADRRPAREQDAPRCGDVTGEAQSSRRKAATAARFVAKIRSCPIVSSSP